MYLLECDQFRTDFISIPDFDNVLLAIKLSSQLASDQRSKPTTIKKCSLLTVTSVGKHLTHFYDGPRAPSNIVVLVSAVLAFD